MQCSKLNYHLFLLYVRASYDFICSHNREDANPYLLQYPLYFQNRNYIIHEISSLGICETQNIILYGSIDVDIDTNHTIRYAV